MAGPESKSSSHFEINNNSFSSLEKIKYLKEKDLYSFYYPLINKETKLYTNGNTAEHKLIFLVGGPENDVTVAKDHAGQPIYTNPPGHPKLPEIPEATAAISDYFEKKSNLINALSEIADIFHNLTALTKLDRTWVGSYKNSINYLANSLSFPLDSKKTDKFTVNNGLLLAFLKYNERLVNNTGKKDHSKENRIIEKAITTDDAGKTLINLPTDEGLMQAYRAINEIGNDVIKPRLTQIKRMSEWNGLKNNEKVIFSATHLKK